MSKVYGLLSAMLFLSDPVYRDINGVQFDKIVARLKRTGQLKQFTPVVEFLQKVKRLDVMSLVRVGPG